ARAAGWRVGSAGAGQQRDLRLLGGELVARLDAVLACLLARGDQLPARALGERLHPDRVEHVVGRAQLPARVDASAFAAQPLPIDEVCAGEVRTDPRAAQPVDRLAVKGLGGRAVAQPRPRTSLDAAR